MITRIPTPESIKISRPLPPTPNSGRPLPPTPNSGRPLPPIPNSGRPLPPTPGYLLGDFEFNNEPGFTEVVIQELAKKGIVF